MPRPTPVLGIVVCTLILCAGLIAPASGQTPSSEEQTAAPAPVEMRGWGSAENEPPPRRTRSFADKFFDVLAYSVILAPALEVGVNQFEGIGTGLDLRLGSGLAMPPLYDGIYRYQYDSAGANDGGRYRSYASDIDVFLGLPSFVAVMLHMVAWDFPPKDGFLWLPPVVRVGAHTGTAFGNHFAGTRLGITWRLPFFVSARGVSKGYMFVPVRLDAYYTFDANEVVDLRYSASLFRSVLLDAALLGITVEARYLACEGNEAWSVGARLTLNLMALLVYAFD